jgi:diaminopimelate epimerase
MIPFIKAHACGNDFLIISEEAAQGFDKSQLTQRLCDRYTGVGADGIEYFAWTGDTSARVQLYNADGSLAEISGNGTRCVAAWMAEDKGARKGDQFSIQTGAGPRICTIDDYRPSSDIGPTVMVTTDMGVPEWQEQTVELADGTQIDGVFANIGNPHFVIVLPASNMVPSNGDLTDPSVQNLDFSINDRSWQEIGEEICYHADFPNQTNVEFVIPIGVVTPVSQVALRIYERGVGPTSSSGSGTCATATAMMGVYGGASPMEVAAPGGVQTVTWAADDKPLYLTGPATLVSRGEAW